MKQVENSRDRLHIEYNAKGLFYVFTLIPFILIVYALCFMQSSVSIDCVYSATNSQSDTCTIARSSLLGSSALATKLLPRFMTGSTAILPLSRSPVFEVETVVTTHTDDDG